MFCPKCGTKIEGGSKFCHTCGVSTTATTQSVALDLTPVAIKCGNCDYVGVPEKARNTTSVVLAWLCIFFAPFITLIYFAATSRYRCPKCKSNYVSLKGKDGSFGKPSKNAADPWVRIIWILVIISIVGIVSSVILAALNSAR